MINEYEKGDLKMASPAPAPEPQQVSAEFKGVGVAERLNFNVSPAVAAETRQLAEELHMSMTQLFKYAMSILKIAVVEGRKGRKLVIADENAIALREFVLPGLGLEQEATRR
jgi:hypothetical protein